MAKDFNLVTSNVGKDVGDKHLSEFGKKFKILYSYMFCKQNNKKNLSKCT
jgi:hypothetical protein